MPRHEAMNPCALVRFLGHSDRGVLSRVRDGFRLTARLFAEFGTRLTYDYHRLRHKSRSSIPSFACIGLICCLNLFASVG